ncbi:MAG: YraN family protein [Candidatus Taylorbacteria bacterium]|nr:YraN family protein [Candidatus Taylorbacteria bacterium]
MDNKTKGRIGENLASRFLEKNGFTIVARNYMKKWGELDIVAQKDGTLHFVEVKSVTYVQNDFIHTPEENVHAFKMSQIRRMIRTFLMETNRGVESEFYFHVLCVYMNMKTRKARIKWIKNIIL